MPSILEIGQGAMLGANVLWIETSVDVGHGEEPDLESVPSLRVLWREIGISLFESLKFRAANRVVADEKQDRASIGGVEIDRDIGFVPVQKHPVDWSFDENGRHRSFAPESASIRKALILGKELPRRRGVKTAESTLKNGYNWSQNQEKLAKKMIFLLELEFFPGCLR